MIGTRMTGAWPIPGMRGIRLWAARQESKLNLVRYSPPRSVLIAFFSAVLAFLAEQTTLPPIRRGRQGLARCGRAALPTHFEPVPWRYGELAVCAGRRGTASRRKLTLPRGVPCGESFQDAREDRLLLRGDVDEHQAGLVAEMALPF